MSMIFSCIIVLIRDADIVQHLPHSKPTGFPVPQAITPQLRMGFLKLLEAGWFSIEMSAKKAKDAAGTSIAHVINFAVRHVVFVDVGPHVIFQPESHRR